MAKRQIKFITVPISLWESADLTIAEKHLLIDIDSICDSAEGVAVGTQALASLSGMAQKDVKSAILFLTRIGSTRAKNIWVIDSTHPGDGEPHRNDTEATPQATLKLRDYKSLQS